MDGIIRGITIGILQVVCLAFAVPRIGSAALEVAVGLLHGRRRLTVVALVGADIKCIDHGHVLGLGIGIHQANCRPHITPVATSVRATRLGEHHQANAKPVVRQILDQRSQRLLLRSEESVPVCRIVNNDQHIRHICTGRSPDEKIDILRNDHIDRQ
ncbi:hypothetical protein D3C78_1161050 [compost metagenome]